MNLCFYKSLIGTNHRFKISQLTQVLERQGISKMHQDAGLGFGELMNLGKDF
jgi:hypothetical protein